MLITRFAPTPSGFLHLGNAYNFILAWLIARANKGVIWLRIDDLDRGRYRQKYLDAIFRDLEWLRLDWDYGPSFVSDFEQHSQYSRMELYREAIERLQSKNLLYGCLCSRKQIRSRSPERRYDGFCRGQPLREGHAYRISVDESAVLSLATETISATFDDFLVKKKDGTPSYQLASIVDDESMKINYIVRGADLYESTLMQLYLSQKLDYFRFAASTFVHHPLLLDSNGRKMSKSCGAKDISSMREAGFDTLQIFRSFAQWRCWKELPSTIEELLPVFIANDELSPARVS